jgi:hypothetical protein
VRRLGRGNCMLQFRSERAQRLNSKTSRSGKRLSEKLRVPRGIVYRPNRPTPPIAPEVADIIRQYGNSFIAKHRSWLTWLHLRVLFHQPFIAGIGLTLHTPGTSDWVIAFVILN